MDIPEDLRAQCIEQINRAIEEEGVASVEDTIHSQRSDYVSPK